MRGLSAEECDLTTFLRLDSETGYRHMLPFIALVEMLGPVGFSLQASATAPAFLLCLRPQRLAP